MIRYYDVTYDIFVTFQVAYLANMTSPPGSKAAQHFATFMGKSVSLCITFQNHCGEKAILCHIATFTLPQSQCHSVSQSSILFSKPFGMEKVIQ